MTAPWTSINEADSTPRAVVEVVGDARATAGTTASVDLRLHHTDGVPRDITLTVVGVEPDWSGPPARVSAVPPNSSVSVHLPVTPAPGAVPAHYPFVVTAELDGGGAGATTVAEAGLIVDEPGSVRVSIEPSETRGVAGRRMRVVLTNSDSRPVPVRLDTERGRDLRLRLARREVVVPAGSSVSVPGRARTVSPRLVGGSTRHPYTVTAFSEHAPASARGSFTARAAMGSTARRVIALTTVVALWATAAFAGLPWLADRLEESRSSEETVAEGGAGADGDDGAAPSDGAPGEDGGGNGGGAEGGAGGGADPGEDDGAGGTDRISGVIEATDPEGVTVEMTPTGSIGDSGTTRADAAPAAIVAGAPVVVGAGLTTVTASRTDDDAPIGKIAPVAEVGTAVVEPSSAVGAVVDAGRSTVTNQDGAWAFGGTGTDGYYLLTFAKPGYQTERIVADAANTQPFEIELEPGQGSLSGTVTGPDGPVGGAELTITDGTVTVSTSSATTGDVGSWAVDGLSTPSSYLISARADGLSGGAALRELPAGGEASADLTLDRGVASVQGTITGLDLAGVARGLGGVRVTASDGDTVRTATTVTTATGSGPVGAYNLPGLPVPGRYTVTIEGSGHQTQTRELNLDGSDEVTRLNARLGTSGATVAGTISTPDGQPLAAGISLTGSGDTEYKVTSGPAGTYRFDRVAPGAYVVRAEVFGHVTGYADVEVGTGVAETVDLVLRPMTDNGISATSSIQGRAVDASTGGGPITCASADDVAAEDCRVTVELRTQDLQGRTQEFSTSVDPSEAYTIPDPSEEGAGLLPGLHELLITAPGYEPERIRVQVPMDATVNAPLASLTPAPSVVGTVTTRVGAIPSGTCVIAMPASSTLETGAGDCEPVGADADDTRCRIEGGRCAFTGLNGSYELVGLESGAYDVAVRSGDSEYLDVAPVRLVLAAGDVRRYDATLDRLGRARVTVLAADGTRALRPADGAVVTVTSDDADAAVDDVEVAPQGDGVVLLTHLQPGAEYRVAVAWADPDADTPTTLTGVLFTRSGLNNEVAAQIVLTGAVRDFSGTVVQELDADGPQRVPDVEVRISGIIGYEGLLPITAEAVAVTDVNGTFRVVPEASPGDGPEVAVLPIIDARVDISATKAGYLPYRADSVAVTDGQELTIALEPAGRPVTGQVVAVGGDPGDLSDVQVTVLSAPPGAEAAQVVVNSAGCLIWVDRAQPVDQGTGDAGPVCGGDVPGDVRPTLARPGDYTARLERPATADRAGYAPIEVSWTVPLISEGAARHVLTPGGIALSQDGNMIVRVVGRDGGNINDARVVLTGPGVPEQTRAATPGTNEVLFQRLPSVGVDGSSLVYTVRVEAAGFRPEAFTQGRPLPDPDGTPGAPVALTVEPGGQVRYVLEMVPLGRIEGQLIGRTEVDEGAGDTQRPLAGALVSATNEASDVTFTTTTRPDGSFSITGSRDTAGLVPGTWTVTVQQPDGFGDVPPAEVTVVRNGEDYPTLYPDGADELTLVAIAEPASVRVNILRPAVDGDTDVGEDGLVPVTEDLTVQLRRQTGTDTLTPEQCGTESTPGSYCVSDIPAVLHTLSIDGGAYAPVNQTVTPEPGQQAVLRIVLAANVNSISGDVTGQVGAQPAAPLEDATVRICGPYGPEETPPAECVEAAQRDASTGATFEFIGLPDGVYVLTAEPGEGSPFTPLTRTVGVQGGQERYRPFNLSAEAGSIEVVAYATNGWPLIGSVVQLEPGEGADPAGTPAAQSVVRLPDLDDPERGQAYGTTFNQVPAGAWSARLTPPAPHVGSYTSEAGTGTLEIDVAEVRLRAGVQARPPATLTDQVTVTVTGPDGVVLEDDVTVGGGELLVYLPATVGYTVQAEAPGSWQLTPESVDVPAGSADVRARFFLEPQATETTLTATPVVGVGENVELTANVSTGGDPVTEGEVRFLAGGATVGTGDLGADGEATVTAIAPTATGTITYTAQFDGDDGLAGSHATATVTVAALTLDEPDPVQDSSVDITGTVTPSSVTDTVELVVSDGTTTTVPVTDGAFSTTLEDLEDGTYTVTAVLDGTNVSSAMVEFTVATLELDASSPVQEGNPVEIEGSVTPGTVTGTVYLRIGNDIVKATTVSDGAFSASLEDLDVGTYTVMAVLAGTDVSSEVTVTVEEPPTGGDEDGGGADGGTEDGGTEDGGGEDGGGEDGGNADGGGEDG